jgi:hypothetical protein
MLRVGMEADVANSLGNEAVELAARHRLLIEHAPAGDSLRLVAPDGSVPITIAVTAEGVTLRIDAPRISLDTSGDLSISADRLTLQGRRELQVVSGSDLKLTAAHDLHTHAQAHIVRSERGSVDVKASDDVKLSGERVLINCDETVNRLYRPPSPR